MRLFRVISLLLCLFMLLPFVASCNGGSVETEPESESKNDTESQSETESETETESLTRVYINEICADNESVYADPSEESNFFDWIEIYNGEDTAISLEGWSLSDSPSQLRKFVFPSVEIEAGGYLIVFACGEVKEGNALYADFKISAVGEEIILVDSSRRVIDHVDMPSTDTDTSYGRVTDGGAELSRMMPTPNATNVGAKLLPEPVQAPSFSKNSGFYDNEFELEINVPEGCTVYYTLDGNTPTDKSQKYSGAFTVSDASNNPNYYAAIEDTSAISEYLPDFLVDKGTVVRAVAYDSDGRCSSAATATYFVGLGDKKGLQNVSVISMTTDESNLFDYDTGIYTKGKAFYDWKSTMTEAEYQEVPYWKHQANYYLKGKEMERPATIEYFDSEHNFVFSQNVGIRVRGGASRSCLQKSFNIYARKEYSGTDKFPIPLFDGVSYTSVFMLRNGGNDTDIMKFRDSIIQWQAMGTDAISQQTYPCVLFLNGEYWGIYLLQEKYSSDFFENHYGVKSEDVVALKFVVNMKADEEALDEYNELCNFAKSRDLSQTRYYDVVCRKIDIDNFIDYFCIQMIIGNSDWPHNNYFLWKTKVKDKNNPYADGRWRWALFDTESSTNLGSSQSQTQDCFFRSHRNDLFMALIENEEFRQKLTIAMMDLLNENYSYENIKEIADEYYDNYKYAMVDYYRRFVSTTNSTATVFRSRIAVFEKFFSTRYQYVEQQFRNRFSLGKVYEVTLSVDSAEAGYIKINSVEPKKIKNGEQWTGRYFADYPITLNAVEKEGYKFERWEINGAKFVSGSATDKTVSLKLSSNITVKAIFSKV